MEMDNPAPEGVIAQEPSNHDAPEQVDTTTVASGSDTDYSYWSDQPDHWSDSSGDDGPQTSTEVGQIINHVFYVDNNDLEIGQDDVHDDVTGYESASEMSSVYEELDFSMDGSQFVKHVAYVFKEETANVDMETSDDGLTSHVPSSDEEDDEYSDSEDSAQLNEDDTEMGSSHISSNGEQEDTTRPVADNEGKPDGLATKVSFPELQQNLHPAYNFALNQSYEQMQWRILELEEIKRTVERELADAQESLEKVNDANYQDFCHKREALGISGELWDEYLAFCESMEPEFGSQGGWSITCNTDHSGSYVQYDPEFTLFKEHSEKPYQQYNFRCEPFIEKPKYRFPVYEVEYVVEFWPVPHLDTNIEEASTWNDLYPALYDLAAKAVRDGSEAAMDMLIALPDRYAHFRGGWLFEYSTASPAESKHHPYLEHDPERKRTQNLVKSRRWAYRSAHNVNAPVDEATKRARLQLALGLSMHSHTGL